MGMMPMVIPAFWNIWNTIIDSTPTHSSMPELVAGQLGDAPDPPAQDRRTAAAASPAPMKPSSSPTAVKMKSVCCSGTMSSWVWVPSKIPLPSTPPEPMAIFDWLRL